MDHKPKTLPPPPTPLKKSKEPVVTAAKAKDTKKTKDHIPKIKVSFSSTKGQMSQVPKTPVVVKQFRAKSSVGELKSFDFNTEVPTVACTPVQRVKAPSSARRGAAKVTANLPFQVYEELSPSQDKPQPVPAAPKRTKKSRFKVQIGDRLQDQIIRIYSYNEWIVCTDENWYGDLLISVGVGHRRCSQVLIFVSWYRWSSVMRVTLNPTPKWSSKRNLWSPKSASPPPGHSVPQKKSQPLTPQQRRPLLRGAGRRVLPSPSPAPPLRTSWPPLCHPPPSLPRPGEADPEDNSLGQGDTVRRQRG